MRLFLDTSVLLAAAGSAAGGSRELFRRAEANGWILIATPYVLDEVLANLGHLPGTALSDWARLRSDLIVCDDVVTLSRPVVFPVRKDRPILFSALAWADVLLTLDRADFEGLLGKAFYELPILTPGGWLTQERAAGRLK